MINDDDQISDLAPLSPNADLDEIREYLTRLDTWRRTREPVADGSVLGKFMRFRDAVNNKLLTYSAGLLNAGGDVFVPDETLTAGSGVTGADGTSAPAVALTADAMIFVTDSVGSMVPADITLTATIKNIPGPVYEWLIDGVVQVGETGTTLLIPQFPPTDFILVRVNVTGSDGSSAFDVMSIYSLQDGSDALLAGLDNENQSIACDPTGVPLAAVNITATMVAVKGAFVLTSPAVSFSVVESTGIESAGTTTGASAHVAINSTTGVISITQITSDAASATFRATIGTETRDKVLTLNKIREGVAGSNAQLLTLNSTGGGFIFSSTAATTTSSPNIVFDAVLANISGTVTFVATAYDAAHASLGTVTLTGVTATQATLTGANFVNGLGTAVRYVKVVATIAALTDVQTVYRGDSGSDGLTALLTNEAHTLQATAVGFVASYTGCGGTMAVYKGTTLLSSGTTPSVSFALAPSGNPQGLSYSLSSTTGVYSVTAIADGTDTATLTFRATLSTGETLDKVFSIAKSRVGATATVYQIRPTAGVIKRLKTGAYSPNAIVFDFLDQNGVATSVYYSFYKGTGTTSYTWGSAITGSGTQYSGQSDLSVSLTTSNTALKIEAYTDSGRTILVDTLTVPIVNEGVDTITGYLTNESVTLAADNSGNITGTISTLTAGFFKVYQGITDVTASATFGAPTNVGCTVATPTSGTGAYNASAMSADSATSTMTATYGGVTITKVLTLAKSKTGATGAGTAGVRGSLNGYSTSVSPAIYSTSPWNGGTDDDNAGKLIWVMLGNSAGSWVFGTISHLRIGDTVTLRNSGGTAAFTKFWSGSAWLDPGTVISGNLLVGGTISGAVNLNITGYAKFEGSNSYTLSVLGGATSLTAAAVANTSLASQIGFAGLSSNSAGYGVYASNSNASGTALLAIGGSHGVQAIGTTSGVQGFSNSSTGAGVRGYAASINNANNIGVYASTDPVNAFGTALYVNGPSTFTKPITSTQATGTAPFAVTSTTENANLNAALLKGKAWAAPDPIGLTTPAAGAFTTLSATGVITSTVSGTNISILLPVISAKPTAVNGGFALHSTYGPIFSNGTSWFAASALQTLP